MKKYQTLKQKGKNFVLFLWKIFRRRFEKIRLWWLTHLAIPLGGVSRIHYYEARERYFTLVALVRYHAKLCDLNFPDFEHDKNFECPRDIEKINKDIGDRKKTKEEKEKCFALLSCYESLIACRKSLTRKEGDLNLLWRTLARVRSHITRIIVRPDMQAEQLFFCQEEAVRLRVDNDPSIKSMIQELAESIDSKGGSEPSPKYTIMLKALIERFNTIRTDRIHQQYVSVKTYIRAFVALMLLSFILIHNHDFIMDPLNNKQFIEIKTEKNTEKPSSIKPGAELKMAPEFKKQKASFTTSNFLRPLYIFIENYLKNNMFALMFFGGLIGGFFSVATRARSAEQEPGEDAYYSVYIMTKPFIGALGAILLYILINANFMSQNFVDKSMMKYLREPGAVAFGFAFIAGFSERIVFPRFR